MKEAVLEKFRELFGDAEGVNVYFAPGRVNLIGEHTDYNGGHVFPCALTIGTYVAARKRADRKLTFYSMNFDRLGILEGSLDDLTPLKDADWTSYPKGVMWAFAGRGMEMDCGLDIVLYGNIPNGSGLSSSASLEVVTGYVLKDLYGFDVSNVDLAKIGQYSENNYNGMNCGIMDQFASAMGKKDNAIFLDTADLSYEYAPLVLDGAKIVVTNSNVKHSLVNSAYNERRSECEKALEELQKGLAAYEAKHPYRHGMKKAEIQTTYFKNLKTNLFMLILKMWEDKSLLRCVGEYVSTVGFETAKDELFEKVSERLLDSFEKAGYEFMKYSELAIEGVPVEIQDDILNLLREDGSVVKVCDDCYSLPEYMHAARKRIAEMLSVNPVISISQVRDEFGTSRKCAKQILTYTDSMKITRKTSAESEWTVY